MLPTIPPTPRSSWARFLALARPFFRAEGRRLTWALLALLLVFILALVGLNVLSSYMNRDFMTAVAEQHASLALRYGIFWVAVFLVLTVVAVLKAFTEERLRLRWRAWLTRYFIDRYLAGRAYYHLRAFPELDNPDQRIAEDVRTFTDQTIALTLIALNSAITLVSFASVLWAITPWLLAGATAYALFGSLTTVLLGRRLVTLDSQQFKKEADFRFTLMQVRTHAEPVALLGGEQEEKGRLRRRLDALVQNMKAIISLSRRISLFTTGYDYLTVLLPLLIVAPLFVRGQVEFGAVTQAQMAFLHVMGAFSLIVKEFTRISTLGAVVERLGAFHELTAPEPPVPAAAHGEIIETVEDPGRVAFEELTLVLPQEGRVLIRDLNAQAPHGCRLLILGPRGSGRSALLRATAGLWTTGHGRVIRPPLGQILFLPETPYLRPGTLRDQFVYGHGHPAPSDDAIRDAARTVELEPVLKRFGGLDARGDWPTLLSPAEQQQLALARLMLANPPFAFLDEPTAALPPDLADRLYAVLHASSISYLSVGSDLRLARFHDEVLQLNGGGRWRLNPDLDARAG